MPRRRSWWRRLRERLSLREFFLRGLERRPVLQEALRAELNRPMLLYRNPLTNNFFARLGTISLVLFLILVGSGLLLLMYYVPSTGEAHHSVVLLSNEVPFGWLIRGVHYWAANLLIVTVMAHMARIFFSGAYKPPRDFNWVTGVVLIALVICFEFTGYLLPWSQEAYWATTVGTNYLASIPLIGETLMYLLRAGMEVNQLTLTRFFAFHVGILPTVTIIVLALHFLLVRRQGMAEPL
ncbi:MAG: cytochrome b N-terminal domain-containing protein [Candidatus Tectimicrobiota bacterium]